MCYLRETRLVQLKREDGRRTRRSSVQYEMERNNSSWGLMAARTHTLKQSVRNRSFSNRPLLRRNFLMSRDWRRESTAFTKNANLLNILGWFPSSCESSSKSKTWRCCHRWRHLRETRFAVATEVLVGRKERMWQRSESGRVLNLSVLPPSSFSSSLRRFEVDFVAIAVWVTPTTLDIP